MLKDKRSDWLKRSAILIEALPNMRHYSGEIVVIKYGGHAMNKIVDDGISSFAQDISLLRQVGVKPVVVHGGGPQINTMMQRLGLEPKYIQGNRVTDKDTINVVEMVLGQINKILASKLSAEGAKAIGLSGRDAKWITAKKITAEDKNLGLVGKVDKVDTHIIKLLSDAGYTPVIAPIAEDKNGINYNINADSMAGAIAGALKAKRLLILSDIDGVHDKNGEYLNSLKRADCLDLIAKKVAVGGMIPKLKTCCDAIEKGVESVAILNGKKNHSILLELFTEIGGGSLITP